MKKPHRYIIYVIIGMVIYYLLGADKNPEVLKDFHNVAPVVILGVIIMLIVVRVVIERKKKDGGR